MTTQQTQLDEFTVFIKKAAPFMKKMKEDMANYLTKKQMLIKAYAGTAAELAKYEDENLHFYVNQQTDQLVLINQDHQNLIESFKHTVDNLRNPFTDLYHWIKGEIYDMSAFNAALGELKAQAEAVTALKKKIAQGKTDMENIQAGKKTMSTMFKGTGDVHTIANQIERNERDLEAQTKLHFLMLNYLSQRVLPKFKSEKLHLYSRII